MYQFTSAFVTSFNVSAKSRTQWQLHFELKHVLFRCCLMEYTIVRRSQGLGKNTLWALLLIQQTERKYAIILKTVNSFLHSVRSLASVPRLQASKKQLTLSVFSFFHGLLWNSLCPGHADIMHTYFRVAILQTLLCKLDCTYKDAHRPRTNNSTVPQQRLQSLPPSITSSLASSSSIITSVISSVFIVHHSCCVEFPFHVAESSSSSSSGFLMRLTLPSWRDRLAALFGKKQMWELPRCSCGATCMETCLAGTSR